MKIAVIGGNGKAGRLIIKEGIERGMDMTAIVRSENKSPAQKVILKDLFNLTYADIKDFDVVVTAFGVWKPEEFPQHSSSLMHLCDVISGSSIRLIVVGGAGNLLLNREKGIRVIDNPEFPEEFKPLAISEVEALEALKKRSDVKWTYISPALDFRFDGEKTGKYILSDETFKTNDKGKSILSYSDYAVALIDEAVEGNNIQKAISIVGI